MTKRREREAWEDECPHNKQVACRDPEPDCARCGWSPEAARRRAEAIRAAREKRTDCRAGVRAGSQ